VFLEPTRPFSVKAFDKLGDLLGQAGEDRITVKVRLQSLPWHMYSGVIVRCILADPRRRKDCREIPPIVIGTLHSAVGPLGQSQRLQHLAGLCEVEDRSVSGCVRGRLGCLRPIVLWA